MKKGNFCNSLRGGVFSLFVLLNSFALFAQNITVHGTITDANNEPIIGATIMVKGSAAKGTATDVDGKYTLANVSPNAIFEVSYVGMQSQEIAVNGRTTINIVMKDDSELLDEVVVVGFGTQKKENLTGAVATIDNKVLADRPITRLSQGLQGAIANLNISTTYSGGSPNATQSLNIRGFTGFGEAGSPLIVIDGVQAGDINSLNANDIENITVIKDAAASAIYGSSAPYGVILITTKRGKSGKPTVTYNNSFIFNTPMGMPKMLNSIEFANIFNEAGVNAGRQPYSYFSKETIQKMRDFQAGKITTETTAVPNAGADYWFGWFGGNANYDWFDVYYKDVQLVQQHNLSLSGGSDKNQYFLGLGYNDKPGMLEYGKDIYKRYNVRANIKSNVNDWLEVGFRSSYSKETYDAPWAGGNRTGGNWMHQIARKHPNVPLYLPDGSYSEISDVPIMLEGGRQLENWDKPVLTGEIVLTPLKNWNTTVNYTYEANIWNNSGHKKTVYSPLPSGKLEPIGHTYPNEFNRSTGFQYHTIFNAFSTYELNLQQHGFKIMGGYVKELRNNLRFWGGNNQLYTDNIPAIKTTYGKTPWISDAIGQLASEGLFGRFNYNFDQKYLLEVTGRYDGTSRFLSDKRWGFYPGVSAGWNIHKESFWGGLNLDKYVETLKIRGSYGSLGDQEAVGKDNWYPFYPNLYTGAPTASNWYFENGREARTGVPGLINEGITWVTTSTLDFGFDLSALNNRLTAVFDWYKRSSTDYLGPSKELPAVLGTGVPQENVSAIEVKGFELTLGWRDIIGDFSYNLRGVLSNYSGYVTKFPNPQKLLNNWYEGEEMGSIYGYNTVGYFTGDADVINSPSQKYIHTNWGAGDIKYADLNDDGEINVGKNTVDDSGDLSLIGNTTPKYQYSLLGDFSWKNIDLSLFFQGVGKRQYFFGGWANYFWGINGSEWQSSTFTVHRDRWTPTNIGGYFPKYYLSGENYKNTQTQTKYLQNAAYLRLKNIQLGYTLPNAYLNKVGVQKLRVFTLIENVFTISPIQKHSTIDPETFFSDMKIYPMQRGYSFGLNITF